MSLTIVTTILGLITQVLPLLGVAGSSATMITSIIATIERLLPIILTFIPNFYQSVKGIIQAVSADPATTQDQLLQLQTIDAQLDAAFEAAAKDVDPDAPPSA